MTDELDRPELLDPGHLGELTTVVLQVLDDWGLQGEEQAALLGLALTVRRGRARLDLPLSPDRQTLQRLSYVLQIERAVRTAFPHNVSMARYWVTTPHPLFEGRSPLQVMLAGGLEGMEQIVSYLTCTGEW
jgi:uncharacterized protein (DUF2384 family)